MKSCGYPCVPSAIAVFIVALFVPLTVYAQIDILTNRYDPQRTGANLRETKLTAANVNVDRFGKLYSYPVDGAVYAQPLYVSGVTINGIQRNVLYVATMNDMVYAFDADGASASPLWTRKFTNPPSVTAVPITDIVGPNLNILGNVGIQSTPVIDRATGTLYLVARTKENGAYVQRLHALDIATGQSRAGSPVTIQGSAPGTALDASGGVITFDAKRQNQRAGLALSNGVVLVAWASHEDAVPYHGWIMGFDATTLARVGVFLTTADAYRGGIWQGGRAPTIDASGHAYFATGNGAWDGVRNFGDSLLKFNVSRTGLSLVDYFTPGNEAQLNIDDDDLSGSGFTLLPGTNLLIGGGKESVLYLLNADPLGHKVTNDTQVVQKFPTNGGHVMGGPVFWQSAAAGSLVYNWSEDDVLKGYRLKSGQLENPPYLQGQIVSPGHPGGSLAVSANGSTAGTGIVWASLGTYQDGIHGPVAGVLRAFDAETLRELWNSEQNAARDGVGTLMKFVPPVVANGKVYLPNQQRRGCGLWRAARRFRRHGDAERTGPLTGRHRNLLRHREAGEWLHRTRVPERQRSAVRLNGVVQPRVDRQCRHLYADDHSSCEHDGNRLRRNGEGRQRHANSCGDDPYHPQPDNGTAGTGRDRRQFRREQSDRAWSRREGGRGPEVQLEQRQRRNAQHAARARR